MGVRSLRPAGLAMLLGMLASGPPSEAQSHVAPFLTILPGITTKAEVDLTLGDPRRRLVNEEETFEYPPPRDVDADKIVIAFWSDSRTVARIDVYFKASAPADALRARIGGTRVVSRDHRGAREELFYPRLHALILATDGQAAAFSYLSPRYLASVYIGRFEGLVVANDLEAALVEAEKAAAVDPEGAQGYLAQARYYEATGQLDEALARYTAAAGAKTGGRDKLRATLGLAALYEQYRKAPDRADAEYKRAMALAMRADAASVRAQYADFLTRQKRLDEARVEYERALEVDPIYLPAHLALAAIKWDDKAYRDALVHYEIAANGLGEGGSSLTGKDGGLVWFRYAYCLADAGREEEALAAYERSLGDPTVEADTRYQRGVLFTRRKDYLHSIAEFREGLRVAPTHGPLNRGLTNALLLAGSTADARRQAETALKLAPHDPERLLDMARTFGALKKKKEALDYVRRALAAGFSDRHAMTSDPALALLQSDGEFRKLVAQLR